METTKESESDSEGKSEGGGEGEGEEMVDEDEDEDAVQSGEEPLPENEELDMPTELWRAREQANAQSSTEPRSREGQRSGSSSPGSQLESTMGGNGWKEKEIKERAAIEAYKGRAREKRKYHSRRGAERIGRAKGSKAKQDNRVTVDKSGLWD